MELKTNIDSGDVNIKRSEDGKETTVTKEPETVKKDPDLVTRVSQTKLEEEPTGDKKVEEPEFDFKDIEELRKKDPEAAAWAEKSYKSFQKGFNQKFQEIADLRKKLESQSDQPDTWTPERLQQEMNKPEFVAAAQQVIQTQQPEDELMSETEKKQSQKVAQLEKELNVIKQQSYSVQKNAEDELLKGKYADYDSKAMDILTADMIAGRVQATREYLYKAVKFDEAVKKAYELGRTDKNSDNQEKVNSMSAEGITQQSPEGALKKEEGETSKQFFLRNALSRYVQKKSGQIK